MASHALAQSTTAPTTVSIYLPFDGDNLAASVITAAPTATVYAIGCEVQSGACAPGCSLDSSVTVTEGESTLRYTWSNGMHAAVAATGASLVPDVTTVACSLYGGTRATSAVCTAYSAVMAAGIPGGPGMPPGGMMNNGTQTTTLASSQISYIPITLNAPNTMAATMGGSGTNTVSGPTSSSSSGGGGATNAGSAIKATRYVASLAAAGVAGAFMVVL
ncbi:hypothetical protein B0A55_01443 [Friedmanniomyces simplex]|uniref:Uncharacterized protein n=1 Tax=Friedmanniomyces simplex TaxID=329884 RepID=A0A4U0Y2J2_9PEZI|nr:hypothetical protein B0A55_01443 [Friedmanniomyces simplex]